MPIEQQHKVYEDLGNIMPLDLDDSKDANEFIEEFIAKIGENDDALMSTRCDEEGNWYISLYRYREETAEEAEARIAQAARWDAQQEENRKKDYEMYKRVYEEGIPFQQAYNERWGIAGGQGIWARAPELQPELAAPIALAPNEHFVIDNNIIIDDIEEW